MELWEYRGMGLWRYGSVEAWDYGSMSKLPAPLLMRLPCMCAGGELDAMTMNQLNWGSSRLQSLISFCLSFVSGLLSPMGVVLKSAPAAMHCNLYSQQWGVSGIPSLLFTCTHSHPNRIVEMYSRRLQGKCNFISRLADFVKLMRYRILLEGDRLEYTIQHPLPHTHIHSHACSSREADKGDSWCSSESHQPRWGWRGCRGNVSLLSAIN